MRLEHQIELADIREVVLAAVRTRNLLFFDIGSKLIVGPAFDRFLASVFVHIFFDKLVGAEARLAGLAVHERIVEAPDVTGSDPGLRVHQNRGVKPYVVRGLLDKLLPPGFFDVVLHFDTDRAVIPRVRQSVVNFRTREDNPPGFGQTYDLAH